MKKYQDNPAPLSRELEMESLRKSMKACRDLLRAFNRGLEPYGDVTVQSVEEEYSKYYNRLNALFAK